jgi:hypothetical protein
VNPAPAAAFLSAIGMRKRNYHPRHRRQRRSETDRRLPLHQTIVNADRFVYSPFQSDEISPLFKGECQNYRIVIG